MLLQHSVLHAELELVEVHSSEEAVEEARRVAQIARRERELLRDFKRDASVELVVTRFASGACTLLCIAKAIATHSSETYFRSMKITQFESCDTAVKKHER